MIDRSQRSPFRSDATLQKMDLKGMVAKLKRKAEAQPAADAGFKARKKK